MTEFVLVARFDKPIDKQKMSKIVGEELNVKPKIFYPKKNVMVTLMEAENMSKSPFKEFLEQVKKYVVSTLGTKKITLIVV
jgi:hypothetical protein